MLEALFLAMSRPPSQRGKIDRRSFLKVCVAAAAAVGLPVAAGEAWASEVAAGRKPSVIWLSFQECTGCTESLLRPDHPTLEHLILDLVSLDYHETLLAPSGHQAEQAREQAMEENDGKFILVVEGAIPKAEDGIYCMVGGRTALDIVRETAERAGAIIAIGSCASFGGLPAADPNPTGAAGLPDILPGKTIVTLPGCPPNPYNFLGTALQYATLGTLPALDALGRPLYAYGRTIHEHCQRRAHFDAGRFAEVFGDEGHRQAWCLYKLGCKGPQTHANCSVQHFGEVTGAWPIGIGHPCIGCTEKHLLFRVPLHDTVDVERPEPPDHYPKVHAEHEGGATAAAARVAGVIAGGLMGAGYAASRNLDKSTEEES